MSFFLHLVDTGAEQQLPASQCSAVTAPGRIPAWFIGQQAKCWWGLYSIAVIMCNQRLLDDDKSCLLADHTAYQSTVSTTARWNCTNWTERDEWGGTHVCTEPVGAALSFRNINKKHGEPTRTHHEPAEDSSRQQKENQNQNSDIK